MPLLALAGCAVLAVACGGSPARPDRCVPLRARRALLAFGDSITSGEVRPDRRGDGLISRHVVVPAASIRRSCTCCSMSITSAGAAISVINAVQRREHLRAVSRFDDGRRERPDAAIIMHGINNLAVDRGDVPTILIRRMVQSAKSRGVAVFVGSMLPTLPDREKSQSQTLVEDYNARLKQMSMEEGVVFVDLYDALRPEAASVIGIDGLHPTEAGYRRIAEVFFTAIASTLEE
jgi:lysophospholipase L1-like esterase